LNIVAEPWYLILLSEKTNWDDLLRERLDALDPAAALVRVESWSAVQELRGQRKDAVLLVTPESLSQVGAMPLPVVLLLEDEPVQSPVGVCDWLVRDQLSEAILSRCLRYVRDQGRLRSTLQRLTEQDALTGIANRQGFQTLLAARLEEKGGRGLALVYLDLDNFHQANDTLGYRAGDLLIQQVVIRLKAQLGRGDQLARLGGDEFALLLETRNDLTRLKRCVQRLSDALSEPYWLEGESLLLGCSFGVVQARAKSDADTLMWQAQCAMQQAKRRQGNTYHLYDQRLDEVMHSQTDFVGVEALVRWQHEKRGLMTPDVFVPLAEESGMIVPLGYWVIARALTDMRHLQGSGWPGLSMAVNLSFRQFQDSQLLPTLERLIERHAIDSNWLEFELTETAVMRRSEHVQQIMHRLDRLGIRFSLDDFGTGFSSFEHLSNLPIALLKIDRSFVTGMELRPQSQQLVQAMINLAHNLDLEVVAEGVETSEQLQLLQHYGCDQIQGYLIGRAMPLAELQAFLVARQGAGASG
jgi:diguanylate cyclase (GGDEF)-like protein